MDRHLNAAELNEKLENMYQKNQQLYEKVEQELLELQSADEKVIYNDNVLPSELLNTLKATNKKQLAQKQQKPGLNTKSSFQTTKSLKNTQSFKKSQDKYQTRKFQ